MRKFSATRQQPVRDLENRFQDRRFSAPADVVATSVRRPGSDPNQVPDLRVAGSAARPCCAPLGHVRDRFRTATELSLDGGARHALAEANDHRGVGSRFVGS